ncbi:hypothetical protein HZB02_02755 [Candidatus Woesearchaeota archaeon]|nr:hypothetical protein [Candidatus Woesearchaeota archaeon]
MGLESKLGNGLAVLVMGAVAAVEFSLLYRQFEQPPYTLKHADIISKSKLVVSTIPFQEIDYMGVNVNGTPYIILSFLPGGGAFDAFKKGTDVDISGHKQVKFFWGVYEDRIIASSVEPSQKSNIEPVLKQQPDSSNQLHPPCYLPLQE